MVRTESVVGFFDRLASGWDANMVRREDVIRTILDNAGVAAGKTVLDVACGTGVLIPDYLERGAASVTAIDISPNMAAIAREKFRGKPVQVLCGDAAETAYDRTFDCIVVYNAFPHFADPERLIERLAAALSPGGSLTIAHGMSREQLDAHHGSVPEDVSDRLMPVEALAAVLKRYLRVTVQISDDRMYQAVAVRDA